MLNGRGDHECWYKSIAKEFDVLVWLGEVWDSDYNHRRSAAGNGLIWRVRINDHDLSSVILDRCSGFEVAIAIFDPSACAKSRRRHSVFQGAQFRVWLRETSYGPSISTARVQHDCSSTSLHS